MTKRLYTVKAFALFCLLTIVLTSCVNDTKYSGNMNVIEATDVLADSSAVVIDARGSEAYAKGHLEGAVMISPSELVVDMPVPSTIAPKETLEKVLSNAGITNDMTLYVYDDNNGVSASRVWWTLKVYGHENIMVINGGASALVKAGGTITMTPTALSKSTYAAQDEDTSSIATYEDVKKIADGEDQSTVLLDVRSDAEYAEGYIPGAILYPHTRNLYSDGTFMSSRDIGLFYKDLGLEKDTAITLYCKSSFRAAQTYLLLQEAGYTNLKIYDGAWLEWASMGAPAVAVESPVPVTQQQGS